MDKAAQMALSMVKIVEAGMYHIYNVNPALAKMSIAENTMCNQALGEDGHSVRNVGGKRVQIQFSDIALIWRRTALQVVATMAVSYQCCRYGKIRSRNILAGTTYLSNTITYLL